MKDPLINAVVTPRFIPTCTPALLKGLGQLAAQHDLAVQSHISESLDEVATCLQLHPEVRFPQTFLWLACTRREPRNVPTLLVKLPLVFETSVNEELVSSSLAE